MLKGCYLASKNLEVCKIKEHGIYNKILAQYSILCSHYHMEMLSCGFKKNILFKILARLPLFPNDFGVALSKVPHDIDFLFFRFDQGDRLTIKFLSKVKKQNPNCKIIVEVPTYPLQWNQMKWYTRVNKYKHTLCERQIGRFADIIAVYDNRTSLYGHKTLKLSNGVDTNTVQKRTIKHEDSDIISIISVSSMTPGHGVDRLISGIGEYYLNGGSRDIIFHVVGKGVDYNKCKELVVHYNISKHVIMHGYVYGQELSALYDSCDIGVDMLGGHRIKDANFSCTLKSRESWAKGLPLISSADYSNEVSDISKYILRISSDDMPINIDDVIVFYDLLFEDGKWIKKDIIANELRSFAVRNYSFEAVMKPIVDYLLD